MPWGSKSFESNSLRLQTYSELTVDVAVEMPAEIFRSKVSWMPPLAVNLQGIEVVSRCFHGSLGYLAPFHKDYLNFRYHDKRAAYVGELHRQLVPMLEGSESLSHMQADFEAFQGDAFKPCLVLRPDGAKRFGGNSMT